MQLAARFSFSRGASPLGLPDWLPPPPRLRRDLAERLWREGGRSRGPRRPAPLAPWHDVTARGAAVRPVRQMSREWPSRDKPAQTRAMGSRLLSVTVGLLAAVAHASAQSASSPASPQGDVVPIALRGPSILPSQSRRGISGDVEVRVAVRPDGSVESAAIVSGEPLLQPAALEAARQSRFECRGCSEAVTRYSLVFAFQFAEATAHLTDTELSGATVTPSQSRVTIVSEPRSSFSASPMCVFDRRSVCTCGAAARSGLGTASTTIRFAPHRACGSGNAVSAGGAPPHE